KVSRAPAAIEAAGAAAEPVRRGRSTAHTVAANVARTGSRNAAASSARDIDDMDMVAGQDKAQERRLSTVRGRVRRTGQMADRDRREVVARVPPGIALALAGIAAWAVSQLARG